MLCGFKHWIMLIPWYALAFQVMDKAKVHRKIHYEAMHVNKNSTNTYSAHKLILQMKDFHFNKKMNTFQEFSFLLLDISTTSTCSSNVSFTGNRRKNFKTYAFMCFWYPTFLFIYLLKAFAHVFVFAAIIKKQQITFLYFDSFLTGLNWLASLMCKCWKNWQV